MTATNKPLTATLDCAITAAKGEGDAKALPRVDITGYNGGKMAVEYWGDVVIDLAGLQAKDRVPILLNHVAWSIDTVLGQTDAVANDGKSLKLSGAVMAEGPTADRVLALSRNGYKFQASVGVTPAKVREVEAGDKVEVNGRTLAGPFTLVEAGALNEISIVPLGADGSTSARIAAEQRKEKEQDMSEKAKDTAPESAVTAETVRAAAVAEELRIGKVRDVAKDWPEISAKAVADGWTQDKTETEVLRARAAKAEGELKAELERSKRPGAPPVTGNAKPDMTAKALAAAVCLRAGLKQPEKAFDEDTLNAANDGPRIRSLTDLVRAACAIDGRPLDCTRHDTREFLQAAFSTRTIANVLSNVANKFVQEGYGVVEQAWREIASIRPVVDFKTNRGVRLVMANLLRDLAPNGEIEHGTLSDETRTISADTKALMIGVTRQDVINDDLGVLTDVPRRLGFAAGRTLNADFWAALEAADGEFTNARSNRMDFVLTTIGLALAETTFDGIRDSDGNPMAVRPEVLLVPSAWHSTARNLFVSTNMQPGGAAGGMIGESNPFAGMYRPVKSVYLTAPAWYLVANPLAVPLMEVAFLNGNDSPIVETAEADFNTLGIQMRCYYDYGVSFAEHRAGVKSDGEGES